MTDRRRRRQTSLSDDESEDEQNENSQEKPRRPKASECESEGFVADDTSEYESVSGETVEGETETETETEEETEPDEDEFDDEDIIIDENFGGLGQERQSGDGEETPDQKDLDDDEDRKNPAFVPRKGAFYEHDLRIGEETEKEEPDATEDKVHFGHRLFCTKNYIPKKKLWKDDGKWLHDMYRETEQAPKTRDELTMLYGYDIRSRDTAPEAAPSRFKQREDARNRKNRLSDFMPTQGPNRAPQHRAPRPKSDHENEDMYQSRHPPPNKERPSPPSFTGDRAPFRHPPPQRREEGPPRAPPQRYQGQDADSTNVHERPRNTEFNDKPRNMEFDDKQRNREFDEKPRNREFDEKPRNREFDEKPRNREFDDSQKNREFDHNDRPRNRGFDAPNRRGGGFGPPPPSSSSGKPRNDYSDFRQQEQQQQQQQQKWPRGNDPPMPYRQPPVSQSNRSRTAPEQAQSKPDNMQNRPSQWPVPSMTVTNSRSFTNSSFRQIDTNVKNEYYEEFDGEEEKMNRNISTGRFTSSRSDANRNNSQVNVEYEKKEKDSEDTNIVITVVNAPNTSRKSYSRDRRTKVGQTRYNPDITDESKMTVAESIQRSENRQEPALNQFRPKIQADPSPPQQHYSQQQHPQQHQHQQSPPKPPQQQHQQGISYPPQSSAPSQPQKVTPKLNLSRPPNHQMNEPTSNDPPDIMYEHQQQIFREQERRLQQRQIHDQQPSQYHENQQKPQQLRTKPEFQQQQYHEKQQQHRQSQQNRDTPEQQYLERQQHQQQQQQYREKQLKQQQQFRDPPPHQQPHQQPQQYRDKQQQYEQKQHQQHHEPPHSQRDQDIKGYPQSSLPPRLENAAQNRTKRYSTQRQRPLPDSNHPEQMTVDVKNTASQASYYTQAGFSSPIFHPHLSNAGGAIPPQQMPPNTAVTASAPALDRVAPTSQQPPPRHQAPHQQPPRQPPPRQQLPRQQQPARQTVPPPASVASPTASGRQHVFQPRILPPAVQYAVPVSSAALQNTPRLIAPIPSPVLIPAVVARPRQPPPPLLAPQFNIIPYAPAAAVTTQTPLIYGASLPQAPPPPLPSTAVFHPAAPIPSSPTTPTPAQPVVPRYPSPTTVDQAKEVIRGGTTYYHPELQRSPSQTSEGVAKEVYRGGTIFYMADIHQPPRSPVRRVKSAIPIVNPQDVTHESGGDEGSYTDEEDTSNFGANDGSLYPHTQDYSPNVRYEPEFKYEYEDSDVIDGINVDEKSEFEPGYDSHEECEPECHVKHEVNPENELQDELESDCYVRSEVEPEHDLHDDLDYEHGVKAELEPERDLHDELDFAHSVKAELEPERDLHDELDFAHSVKAELEPEHDLHDELDFAHGVKAELEPERDLHDELNFAHGVKAELEPERDLHDELEDEGELGDDIGRNAESNFNEKVYPHLEDETEHGDHVRVNDFDDDFEPDSGSDYDTPTYDRIKNTDMNAVGERLSDIVDPLQESDSSEIKRESCSPSLDQVVMSEAPIIRDGSHDGIASDISIKDDPLEEDEHRDVVNPHSELISDVANAGINDAQLESDSRIAELVNKDISDLVERVRIERETETNLCKKDSDSYNTEPDLCKTEPDLHKTEPDLPNTEADLDKTEPNLCKSESDLCKNEQDLCNNETLMGKTESDVSEKDASTDDVVT